MSYFQNSIRGRYSAAMGNYFHKTGKFNYCKSDNLILYLGIILFCSPQGTAVFWYNLFASGEGDYSTRHAACPVLVGNKWGKYFLYSLNRIYDFGLLFWNYFL